MPTSLRQLNVTYVEAQDRLLLKISTSDNKEYRLWLTRRFTRILLEQLEGMFEDELGPDPVVPVAARPEVARFKHSESVNESAFQKPYEAEPESFPLGEEGLLATTLSYKKLDAGNVAMSLSDTEKKGFTFNQMNRNLQHQLFELLSRAAERADWFQQSAPTVSASLH